jgi:hypothetical protein
MWRMTETLATILFFILQSTVIIIRVVQRTGAMLAIRSRPQLQVLLELQLLVLQIIHHHKDMIKVDITSRVRGDNSKVTATMEPLVTKHRTHSKVICILVYIFCMF